MNRREMLKLTSAGSLAAIASAAPEAARAMVESIHAPVAQWEVFELKLEGSSTGNPFIDVQLAATFALGHRTVDVDGFYDGAGSYKLRFMPDTTGEWSYVTSSNAATLNGKTGKFSCTAPLPAAHGLVGVRNTHHFAYADGTPFFPFGTTCYAWVHQSEELQLQTLETLRTAPFNKIRMCVFPKHYEYNRNEPALYPFERNAAGVSDFSRFNPAYFAHLEQRIADLRALGIEADLILFHPYDRWGYATMPAEADDRYLRYVLARMSAYRNIWWSLANEFDLMKARPGGPLAVRSLLQRDVRLRASLGDSCEPANLKVRSRGGMAESVAEADLLRRDHVRRQPEQALGEHLRRRKYPPLLACRHGRLLCDARRDVSRSRSAAR
jgi:hypothetical protein